MQKNQKYLFVFLTLLLLSSCGETQRVINKGTPEQQYQLATKLFEEGDYSKSILLFEKAIPTYRGKPQMERIQYMVANSYFQEEDFSTAAYYFERFATNYPKSSKKEEALFMSAKSYYEASPVYSLDQEDTVKALKAIQNFIDLYPNSDFFTNSNDLVEKLQYKLEKKDFEIAKGYYKTGEYDLRNYKAAMVAFDNLISDHLGTSFKEDAIYYKFLSAYELATNSIDNVKKVRLENAKTILNKFKKNYPNSEHLEDISKYEKKLDKEMNILTSVNN